MISQRWRKYLYPYRTRNNRACAFWEVDSGQNVALKPWFDVFTIPEMAMEDDE